MNSGLFMFRRGLYSEASTERVWSWELQVDGAQEPFSPTGTDGGDGGARLEVRGGRLEALAAGGGKAGSRAAQGRQNGLRRRSWRRRSSRRRSWRRWPGGPGGVQPGRGGMESQKGLESVGLEVPAVASWRARRWRPGGPGGGVLEGPAVASWRARRWRPGGPGGGVLEGPAAASWRARMWRLLIQLS
ncbi:unnamed protein product [Gadus morhua 'NCC']